MGEENSNCIKIKLALAVCAKEHKEVEDTTPVTKKAGRRGERQTFKE